LSPGGCVQRGYPGAACRLTHILIGLASSYKWLDGKLTTSAYNAAGLRKAEILRVTSRFLTKVNRRADWFCAVGTALALSLQATAGWAQSPIPNVSSSDPVGVDEIQDAIAAISGQPGLDESARSQALELLQAAQTSIRDRIAAEDSAAAFAAALSSAPSQTEKILVSLEQVETPVLTAERLGVRDDATVPELEQLVVAESSTLTNAEGRLAELERQIETQQSRPGAIRARVGELRSLLSAPPPTAPPGENSLVAEARSLALELQRRARNAEFNALNQELLSNSVRVDLLKAQRRAARDEVMRQRRSVEFLQGILNERRQSAVAAAQRSALQAELAASGKHPVVRELAEGNAELTAELARVAAQIERTTNQHGRVDEYARRIDDSFARSRQRLEIGGVNQAIGQLFLEERRNLPQVSQYRAEVRERSRTLANIGLAQVRLEEQSAELTPIDDRLAELTEQVSTEISDPQELRSVTGEIELLLQDRRDLLGQASAMYSSYLHSLGDLDVAQRQLLETAAKYESFLDENLMWIPSSGVIRGSTLLRSIDAMNWILGPENWGEVYVATFDAIRENWPAAFFAALLLTTILILRRTLRPVFNDLSDKVGRLSTDHIGLTLGALGITVLTIVPLPLTLAIVAYALINSPTTTEFTAPVARALLIVAPFLGNTLWFRALSSREGVARIHFGWSADKLTIIRRQLDRLTAIGVPLIFVVALLYLGPTPAHRDSLGRLAFIALMVVLSSINHPLLHPVRGVAADYYKSNPGSWSTRFRWLWYGLVAIGPLLLALGTFVGYTYTSAMLVGRLIDTFWLLLGIALVNLVVLRWLALERRKIAWQMALKKREEIRGETAEQKETQVEGEIPVVESTPLDLDAVDQQTRKLLYAGMFLIGLIGAWGIWSSVLPALGVLDRIALWSQTSLIDGVETVTPVTAADLLLGLVIIAVTLIASRNLPGLMEIAVLQRLTLEAGSRYAINTLVRYVVVTVGVVSVLHIIGWNWSQIQWLVAALSVGLGFGLQEIVANFVSGLIILFERPIRVGDTVTVGQLTGTVSRLRIRATTITDWDRKEILVPNKAFITEQVINWTLTDPITRLVIPVGVSYGSDVQKAHRIMEDTLAKLPLVLDDPPPKVYFVGFGESSLDFKLYVFSRQLSDRLPLTHAVHEAILGALRENGIEIPFPQRDLHLRSVDDRAGRSISGKQTDGD